jgi:hypothetical protein
MARFLQRLGSFSRLIMFDRRGAGASDPVPLDALPTWEEWSEDLRAVLDAVPRTASTRWRSSSPGYGHQRRPTGCWRPCCSATSSGPPSGRHGLGTAAGARCWTPTTRSCGRSWTGSAAAAKPGEVLVSRTVADLVAGSGIPFRDRGLHLLKGVPGTGSSTRSTNERCGVALPVSLHTQWALRAPEAGKPRWLAQRRDRAGNLTPVRASEPCQRRPASPGRGGRGVADLAGQAWPAGGRRSRHPGQRGRWWPAAPAARRVRRAGRPIA